MLGSLSGLLKGVSETVNGALETVSPGITGGRTVTGNLLNEHGVVGDLIDGLETGDIAGAVGDVYADIIGPGGVVNNLAEGGGLGIEGLLDGVLGTADGFLGSGGGLLDGVLGGDLGLLQ